MKIFADATYTLQPHVMQIAVFLLNSYSAFHIQSRSLLNIILETKITRKNRPRNTRSKQSHQGHHFSDVNTNTELPTSGLLD